MAKTFARECCLGTGSKATTPFRYETSSPVKMTSRMLSDENPTSESLCTPRSSNRHKAARVRECDFEEMCAPSCFPVGALAATHVRATPLVGDLKRGLRPASLAAVVVVSMSTVIYPFSPSLVAERDGRVQDVPDSLPRRKVLRDCTRRLRLSSSQIALWKRAYAAKVT